MPDVRGVCMVSLGYHPVIGGAEIQAKRLSEALVRRGINVYVLTRVYLRLPRYEVINGVKVYRTPVFRTDPHLGALSFAIGALIQMWKLQSRFDVIHAHLIPGPALIAGLGGKVLNKPVVAKATGGGFAITSNITEISGSWQATLKRKLLTKLVDRFIAMSHSIERDLACVSIPASQITHIPNGLDTNLFSPLPEKERIALRREWQVEDKRVLVFTGRLRPVKNVDFLINSLPLLYSRFGDDIRLWIVGDGIERANLERLADELGVQHLITFWGKQDDVRRHLRAADVFVLPSLKEGFSNALIEAMAMELPVVATQVVGAAQDFVKHGVNGQVIPHDPAPEHLVDVLSRLWADPALAHEMGHRARQTVVECCSFETVGEEIVSLYHELLRG